MLKMGSGFPQVEIYQTAPISWVSHDRERKISRKPLLTDNVHDIARGGIPRERLWIKPAGNAGHFCDTTPDPLMRLPDLRQQGRPDTHPAILVDMNKEQFLFVRKQHDWVASRFPEATPYWPVIDLLGYEVSTTELRASIERKPGFSRLRMPAHESNRDGLLSHETFKAGAAPEVSTEHHPETPTEHFRRQPFRRGRD